jgi:F-type H+-transporting ATPase subunit alpha
MTGTIISVKDGICAVEGLRDAQLAQVVDIFESNSKDQSKSSINGAIYSIEGAHVYITLFSDESAVKVGYKVKLTAYPFCVPCGESTLGRVISPAGKPIDTGPELTNIVMRCIEQDAPSIVERKSVHQPLQTGILAVDCLIPIGRGQRELIIGDRQTGKTTIAIDSIIAQQSDLSSKNDVVCIYVAIGQKQSSIKTVVETLEIYNAMNYTTVIAANAEESPALRFLAPYVGCTMGEFWRDRGYHVLIVYDDLSKHAVAYRELSLLLRRPPGREAYPGDVFYLHSRLLERAAKLSDEKGAGSMTALPIIETQAGDISAYIPTNVISITDGQIYLDSELFYRGIRPAINVGLSVSRVGSAAQVPALKNISSRLKLDLAQYREIADFAQVSSDIDDITKRILDRGQRLTELLKQPANSPIDIKTQIILIYLAISGYFDGVPVSEIPEFVKKIRWSIIECEDPIVVAYFSYFVEIEETLEYLEDQDFLHYVAITLLRE